ncbi:MmcQ/YjbR family DNA-binding protein [Methylobacterium durans]|uniref:MmcQ/YjbR family DNA-binding protein n=1 Tax=Methylobacterium durans TaxID=2202825 RepID=UPI002AFEF9A9|nr:MmcQ/YjbR family DNA-binding protein [Methylobacterium durans]MEA1834744.1 MmcQ/YjbR family DNA-binding protein [Methylobacterium durans]
MTWDDVVVLGRNLPDVEVSTSFGTPALKVRGKLLTRLRPEDDSLVLPDVPAEEREMLINADPDTFHTTPHYDGYAIVLARLSTLDAARLMPFLERRWRAVAPERLAATFIARGVSS